MTPSVESSIGRCTPAAVAVDCISAASVAFPWLAREFNILMLRNLILHARVHALRLFSLHKIVPEVLEGMLRGS